MNWKMKQYSGCEITFPNQSEPINDEDALKVGDTVWVPGLVGDTWEMVITERNGRSAVASAETMSAGLSFGDDDRSCWVCIALINNRSIANARKTVE